MSIFIGSAQDESSVKSHVVIVLVQRNRLPAYEGMLNVSVSNSTDNIVVKWQWDNADNSKRPSGYLIKWNEKEKQVLIEWHKGGDVFILI